MKKNYFLALALLFTTQFFWAQIAVVQPVSFTSCLNTASDIKTFVVSDATAVLGVDIRIGAPAGFEVSKDGTTFSSNVTLFAVQRTPVIITPTYIPVPATTVYIRMKAHSTPGLKTGNVSVDGNARTNRDFTVSGQVNAGPATPTIIVSGTTTFCAGGSVTLTAPSSTGYVWSNGETSRSITVTTAGTYSVNVSNASGCTASSTGRVVTVNALPSAPSITPLSSTTFCQGGNVVLSSSAGAGNKWSNGATTQSTTVSSAGSYTLTYTDMNGCTSPASAATAVTVNALANTPTIILSGNATVCQGTTVTMTSSDSASPLSTYTWTKDGEFYADTKSITAYNSGMYSVTVNNGVCNSLPSTARKMTVNPRPINPTITTSGPTGLCTGGSVTLTSSSTIGNLWSTGANTTSIKVSTAGTYSLTVTNSFGCTSNDEISEEIEEENPVDSRPSENPSSVTVTVSPIPARPTITASGATTFCAGGMVTLTSSAENCKWSTGATTPSIVVSNSGIYTVKADNEGCQSSASLARTIAVTPLPATPTISAVGSLNLLSGGSVLLTSSSSSANVWSTKATSRTIKVTTAGSYSVTVKGTGGCTATSAPVEVTQGSTATKVATASKKESTSTNPKIAIYPNPSKGTFNIDSDSNGEVSVVNLLGQTVKVVKVKANANNTVNAESLANGIYFVRQANSNKSTKLIINK